MCRRYAFLSSTRSKQNIFFWSTEKIIVSIGSWCDTEKKENWVERFFNNVKAQMKSSNQSFMEYFMRHFRNRTKFLLLFFFLKKMRSDEFTRFHYIGSYLKKGKSCWWGCRRNTQSFPKDFRLDKVEWNGKCLAHPFLIETDRSIICNQRISITVNFFE